MNPKSYLQQAYFLNERINDSLQDLEALRTRVVSTGTGGTSKVKVQESKVLDTIGNMVPAIVDLDAEINRKIDELIQKKLEIEKTIDKVVDHKARSVLLKRYIHFHEWDEIANSLNKTVQRIFQIHRAGLKEIGKLIANYSKL